ncbi:hypothetical protein [Parapedobacter tibetensis]|uniref:hypothetical protein n=1 Tax=Parapedobacter tibetensis TaxID=2972951 RepID=UPI00214D9310|nr:hypothetical protein [Parapedobacter tibetensis]
MKRIPLLPGYFRWLGFVLVFISVMIFLNDFYLPMSTYEFTNLKFRTFVIADNTPARNGGPVYFTLSDVNLGFILIVLGALLGLCGIAFSRKIIEDEFINSLRLFAWSWAIILSILYAVMANLFVFGTPYLSLMVLFPHFLLTLFILIFNIQWWRYSKGRGQ